MALKLRVEASIGELPDTVNKIERSSGFVTHLPNGSNKPLLNSATSV